MATRLSGARRQFSRKPPAPARRTGRAGWRGGLRPGRRDADGAFPRLVHGDLLGSRARGCAAVAPLATPLAAFLSFPWHRTRCSGSRMGSRYPCAATERARGLATRPAMAAGLSAPATRDRNHRSGMFLGRSLGGDARPGRRPAEPSGASPCVGCLSHWWHRRSSNRGRTGGNARYRPLGGDRRCCGGGSCMRPDFYQCGGIGLVAAL